MAQQYIGIDNGKEAYHIGTRYLIVDSFAHHAQDSCHICANRFRVGISQLTSTLKMSGRRYHESLSLFTIESGTVCHNLPCAHVSFYLPTSFTQSTSMNAAWESL